MDRIQSSRDRRRLIARNIEADDLDRRRPPAKPKNSMARSRRPRSVQRVERFQHEKIVEQMVSL
jgi:hypothetical protein